MKNKTARFLLVSIVCIFLLCMAVFSVMVSIMNKRDADAIGELGSLYMSGLSEESAAHFGTTFELRLAQVSALTDAVPPERETDDASVHAILNYHARQRGFDHLALCGKNGTFEMLYGNQLTVEDGSFMQSILSGEEAMTTALDANGDSYVVMGVPAAYNMANGEKSSALAAALPISYIRDTLSVDTESASIYYFIIDSEGNIILHDGTVEIDETNYFERVRRRYGAIYKDGATLKKDVFLTQLQTAMAEGEEYSAQFMLNGERRFLYLTDLPFSEWSLLLLLPYGPLDMTVNNLGRAWGIAAVISCIIILCALSVMFVCYFRLTRKHLRELEATRRTAEHASRAKSDFLSNMSHDIRTPMNGIVGMTTIALANLDNKEQVKNCLDKIAVSSRHLLGLINDILDMSKIESGKLELHYEALSLKDTLENVVNIVLPQAQAKKHSLKTEFDALGSEYVLCDGVRLNQILLNLLGNAVKFTPDGGEIVLSCREEASPRGENFVRVHFRVKDTGIGMTEEFQSKVFEAFAREDDRRVRQIEGSGLGMAITKYIVDAMQGSIDMTSAPGIGTEFHIALDLERAAEELHESAQTEELPDFGGKRVLLAEDNELNREIAEELLSEVGFSVESAENGKICADLFAASSIGYYDVIFMDLRMPVMSGYEATEAIRAMERADAKTVPIIAMSADAFSDDVARCLACGMNAHTAKPIDMGQVCKLLKEFLGKQR